MIIASNINKRFGKHDVLKDVSVSFERGKINLIIGSSGSGKTVLFKCLIGIYEVESGEIYYDKRDFVKMNFKERSELRKETGVMFQGGALFDFLTVEQNVMFPLTMFTNMTYEEKLQRVNFCLQRVNLADTNHLYPDELSGGMKKRAAIARAIVMNPHYLFCDEPNSGLDPISATVIDKLIQEITYEYNTVTVINTHDMNSVIGIGDNISFIHDGQIWWRGNKQEILKTDNKELNEFVFATELAKKWK